MGRITIFTVENDEACDRIKLEMAKWNLPFLEISLTKHPHRRNDMLRLSNDLSIPQVFLNDTYVGGAEALLLLLENWATTRDGSSHANRCNCENDDGGGNRILTMYHDVVASAPDPCDPRLAIPTTSSSRRKYNTVSPSKRSVPNFDNYHHNHHPYQSRRELQQHQQYSSSTIGSYDRWSVELPNGKAKVTIHDMTETLKSILPLQNLSYKLRTYQNCCRGKDIVTAIANYYQLSTSEAERYGRELQISHQLLCHVVDDHVLSNTDSFFFRLRCHQTPHILNSYRIWSPKERSSTSSVVESSMEILARLIELFTTIERDMTDPTTGLIDCKAAKHHQEFSIFEEAICELQQVAFVRLPYETKLAFAINLFNLLVRYAYVKVGIPTSDASRDKFLQELRFHLGEDILSLQDLLHGILRGNRTAPNSVSPPLTSKDGRVRLVLPKCDSRIHFAISMGTKSCPPLHTYTAETIDEELRIVAQTFCNDDDNVRIDEESSVLYLSHKFKLYKEDFLSYHICCGPSSSANNKIAHSGTGYLPFVVLQFLRGEKAQQLDILIRQSKPIKVQFNSNDSVIAVAYNYTPFSVASLKTDLCRFSL